MKGLKKWIDSIAYQRKCKRLNKSLTNNQRYVIYLALHDRCRNIELLNTTDPKVKEINDSEIKEYKELMSMLSEGLDSWSYYKLCLRKP